MLELLKLSNTDLPTSFFLGRDSGEMGDEVSSWPAQEI